MSGRARGAQSGVPACLVAMAYVGARRWDRRLRGVAGKPWALLGLFAGVALLASLQVLALERMGRQAGPDPGLLDPVVRFAPLLLPALLLMSTFSTPLRLHVADVSWVLTAPGGARAVFLSTLMLRPVRFAIIGYLGTVVSRWWLELAPTDAWKVALVAAAVGLVLRLVSFGGHILVVRARAHVALRVLAVAWGVGLLVTAVIDVPGGGWLGLRPLLGWLLAGVLAPERLAPIALLILLTGLIAGTGALVAAARGFEERAEAAARQIAEAQETMRRSRSGQELAATQFRTGLTSLPGWQALAGERALCLRTLAQQRRMLRPTLVGLVAALGIAVALVAVAPAFTWVPAVLLLVLTAASGAGQCLAVELDHHHLLLAPLRPLPSLLWLGAVPVVSTAVQIELVWLPVLAAPVITTGAWGVGAVLIPCLVALAEASGSLAVVVADGPLARVALAFALGALPAATLVIAVVSLGAPTTLVALATVVLLAAAASWLALAARRIRPHS